MRRNQRLSESLLSVKGLIQGVVRGEVGARRKFARLWVQSDAQDLNTVRRRSPALRPQETTAEPERESE